MEPKECSECSAIFNPYNLQQLYCSPVCSRRKHKRVELAKRRYIRSLNPKPRPVTKIKPEKNYTLINGGSCKLCGGSLIGRQLNAKFCSKSHGRQWRYFDDRATRAMYGWAHDAVSMCIKRGWLVQPKECQNCGQKGQRIYAHHDDYGKPLEVKWLCSKCHQQRHKEHQSLYSYNPKAPTGRHKYRLKNPSPATPPA